MEFRESLIRIRRARGMSQGELAVLAGVSRQAVSKWETGESLPDLARLSALAEGLGLSLDALCGREEPAGPSAPPPPPPEKKRPRALIQALLAVLLLALGFLSGAALGRSAKGEAPPLPDKLTVTGLSFADDASSGLVSFRFAPGVVGDGLTYQVAFTDQEGRGTSELAECAGGMCSGAAALEAGDYYSVTLVVGNGLESRSVMLASDLSRDGRGSVSWTPEP